LPAGRPSGYPAGVDPRRLLEELESLIADYRQQIAQLTEELQRHEAALALLKQDLTAANQSDTPRGMHMIDRIRHSAGMVGDPATRKIRDAVREKGHTMRSYAAEKRKQHRGSEARRWSQVSLTRWARGATMPMRIAREIEQDLGLQASKANWPGLTID
jgi:hypothetical protein